MIMRQYQQEDTDTETQNRSLPTSPEQGYYSTVGRKSSMHPECFFRKRAGAKMAKAHF